MMISGAGPVVCHNQVIAGKLKTCRHVTSDVPLNLTLQFKVAVTVKKFTLLDNFFLIVIVAQLFFSCASGKCGFSIGKPYTATGFDSREISGKMVSVMPVLKMNGFDTTGVLSDSSVMRNVHEIRNDLHFITFRQSIHKDSSYFSDSLLNNFIKKLYMGSIPVLQAEDSAWKRIDAELLALVRLNKGHTIHTFSGETHKKIELEGELWDCRKNEVVFRVVVNGICVSSRVRDDEFIIDGVREVFREFPLSSPAYDTQAW
ncbi:MAG TPA: DUF4136 domain-containing protein [Chitinispirillaceae bacterium]|nr:DUF4136 domain-containing protein [Chitinispirillaceae bacterium]